MKRTAQWHPNGTGIGPVASGDFRFPLAIRWAWAQCGAQPRRAPTNTKLAAARKRVARKAAPSSWRSRWFWDADSCRP